LTLS
jgi:hypothetical protein